MNSNQVNTCLPALQKITQQNAFDNNAHEQYSRRENILITGIQESEKEDPIQECVNIFNEALVAEYKSVNGNVAAVDVDQVSKVTVKDISTAHRLPRKSGKQNN